VGVDDGDAVGATVAAGVEISVREKHNSGRRNAAAARRVVFIMGGLKPFNRKDAKGAK
jgi:hypothetical protein